MRLRRAAMVFFLTTQALGVAFSWTWQHVASDVGVPMWGAALILLIPGNFLGPWIAASILWHSGLSLMSLGVISTLLLLLINAAAWYALVRLIELLRRR